jgi:hypothetical protein
VYGPATTQTGGYWQPLWPRTAANYGQGATVIVLASEEYARLRELEDEILSIRLRRLREEMEEHRLETEDVIRKLKAMPPPRRFFPPCAAADAPEVPPPAPFPQRRSPRRLGAARGRRPLRSRPGRKRARGSVPLRR